MTYPKILLNGFPIDLISNGIPLGVQSIGESVFIILFIFN